MEKDNENKNYQFPYGFLSICLTSSDDDSIKSSGSGFHAQKEVPGYKTTIEGKCYISFMFNKKTFHKSVLPNKLLISFDSMKMDRQKLSIVKLDNLWKKPTSKEETESTSYWPLSSAKKEEIDMDQQDIVFDLVSEDDIMVSRTISKDANLVINGKNVHLSFRIPFDIWEYITECTQNKIESKKNCLFYKKYETK